MFLVNGFLRVGVLEALSDDSFKLSSQLANEVLLTAEAVEKWCKEVENVAEAMLLKKNWLKGFDSCFSYKGRFIRSKDKPCGLHTTIYVLQKCIRVCGQTFC